ncbi:MAG: hypothetical protein ACK4PI_04430 [Tepidisphaerales bacterium]
MAVQDAMAVLARALKDLELRWAEARGQWTDEVAQQFEAKYLQMWQREIRTVSGQLDAMAAYLTQVKRECA